MKDYILIIFLLVSMTFGCTSGFEEINTNPNQPEIVEPDYLLNTSIREALNLFGGDMRRRVTSHYSNYVSVGGGQFERYFHFPSSNNGYWNQGYIGALQPLHQIEKNFSDNPDFKNRATIAKIFESYLYSNMVAIWGSIPKTHSLEGTPSTPYDREEDIYYSLLDNLKIAAAAIDFEGDKYPPKSDAMFAGDLLKWKKFANTLRLRLALRIANADPDKAQEVVEEVLNDEANTIMTLNESASAKWGNTSDNWSYLYEYNIFNAAQNQSSINVISESLIQHMLPYNDPRLQVYATTAPRGPHEGEYWGMPKTTALPQGVSMPDNPHSGMAPQDYSQIGELFTRPDAEYFFLSYEESCFLKADAALKGWGGSKTAQEYYYDGVEASMNRYGIPQADVVNYLATPGIEWNTAVDTTNRGSEFEDYLGITTSAIITPDPHRQIVMQQWIAGFYQAFDAWNLIRQTQTLEFPPHFNPDGNEGGTIGYAYVPQRIVYPDEEIQVNTGEYQKAVEWLGGEDGMKTRLWFALPVKKNPYLPE